MTASGSVIEIEIGNASANVTGTEIGIEIENGTETETGVTYLPVLGHTKSLVLVPPRVEAGNQERDPEGTVNEVSAEETELEAEAEVDPQEPEGPDCPYEDQRPVLRRRGRMVMLGKAVTAGWSSDWGYRNMTCSLV